MKRTILHCDMNNFYASVECLKHPELRDVPMAVCGDEEARRGVVLAKTEKAKALGITTGESVWNAKKKCPSLVTVVPHHGEYAIFSKKATEIYSRYSAQIEPFGLDECWLDVTGSLRLFGSGEQIADDIRETIKRELGLTASVGVSFNKVFAKLGSELKKPDAVTVIPKERFKEIVYPLPVSTLWLVGGKTEETLRRIGIRTIGDLAETDEDLLSRLMGKRGRQVRVYARGEDEEEVHWQKTVEDVKSIGNSLTLPKDIVDRDEVKRWLYALAESVSARQRAADVGRANTVHLVVRNSNLEFSGWQTKVSPTSLCGDIAKAAYELFCAHCPRGTKVRLLGVSVSGFDYHVEQLTLDGFIDESTGKVSYEKKERMENAVAKIREKYGYAKLQRGVVLEDERTDGLDIRGKKEEIIPDNEKNEKEE